MRYFAYGSNMDPVQMRGRAPDASAIGAARLPDHRLRFTADSPARGGGVASVERAPGDEVWGVLWEVTAQDEERLDAYEGVVHDAYRKRIVEVEHDGVCVRAMIYVATARRDKPPSRAYLSGIVRGATAHGLPDPYVERLRALAGR